MLNPWGRRCWLLTSPRSGSTYLQFLLNHNAGLPLGLPDDKELARLTFGEHMSPKFCSSIEDFLCWDPVVSKVHCHHFGAFLVDRSALKHRIPRTRFVLLERRDAIAQAVSLAMANLSGVTRCESQEAQSRYHREKIEPTDEELLGCLKAVRDYVQFWRNWLHSEPHLVVTYESLVESPREVIGEILDYLQTSYTELSLDVPLRKIDHPLSKVNMERLLHLDRVRLGCPA